MHIVSCTGRISPRVAILRNMHCPFCRHEDTNVVETRVVNDGYSIRRRRDCKQCGMRFTTLESYELYVEKSSGHTEPFDRSKVINGVRKACQGRPVTEDSLQLLGQRVEEKLRASGKSQVTSTEVGKTILEPLKDLDEVAYLRFASVYQNFESLDDFQHAIDSLR